MKDTEIFWKSISQNIIGCKNLCDRNTTFDVYIDHKSPLLNMFAEYRLLYKSIDNLFLFLEIWSCWWDCGVSTL
jgi:hypothetical protein